jgi:hypothetical protein
MFMVLMDREFSIDGKFWQSEEIDTDQGRCETLFSPELSRWPRTKLARYLLSCRQEKCHAEIR